MSLAVCGFTVFGMLSGWFGNHNPRDFHVVAIKLAVVGFPLSGILGIREVSGNFRCDGALRVFRHSLVVVLTLLLILPYAVCGTGNPRNPVVNHLFTYLWLATLVFVPIYNIVFLTFAVICGQKSLGYAGISCIMLDIAFGISLFILTRISAHC